MQYSIDQVDKAIYYYLTLHKDDAISTHKIFDALCKEDICPDLKNYANKDINKIIFTTECHIIEHKYDDIYKLLKGNTLYLVFTSKSKQDAVLKHSSLDDLQEPVEKPLSIINYMLTRNDWPTNYSFTEKYNETDSILHIVCKEGVRQLLKQLLQNFNVNINSVNSLGQTLKDVLPRNDNGFAMLEDILAYEQSNKLHELYQEMYGMRSQNTFYNELSYTHRQSVKSLKKQLLCMRVSLFSAVSLLLASAMIL